VRHDGSVVGFTQLFPSFSSASTAGFSSSMTCLCGQKPGKRVGALLLAAAASFRRAVGAVRLTLSTELTNEAAQSLYETEGWTRQTEFCVYNLALDPQGP
jgi:GNAT superfamily N-acetyltransferase